MPSFFHTNTTALLQALWPDLMAPDSNISCRWLLTSSTKGGGIHLNHSLKGVSLVTFIVCSVEWPQPNSVGSKKNMSWYLAKSQHVVSTSSGVQESRPLNSNLLNSLSCLCLTVSLGLWESLDSSPPLAISHPQGVLAQVMQLLPWPLGSSFEGSVSKWCCSLPP